MSNPGFYFYPGDWFKDTRVLTLQCRGAWIDLLGELNEHGGSVTWTMADFARFWGCELVQAQALIFELDNFKTAAVDISTGGEFVRDLSGHFPGSVTLPGHAIVTITSRRLKRELKARNDAKLRKQAERERKHLSRDGHVDMSRPCPASLPSPSPSPSLNSSDILSSFAADWNREFQNQLPAVQLPLSNSRKRKLQLRLREHPEEEFWDTVFTQIEKSKFLKGNGNHGWKCTFDFLVANDTNCVKIAEGQYAEEKN